MIQKIKGKKQINIPDLKFIKMIRRYDSLPILFYYERGLYCAAITVNKSVYFIYSSTVEGMKTKLKYLGLKSSIKINKGIFLERKV